MLARLVSLSSIYLLGQECLSFFSGFPTLRPSPPNQPAHSLPTVSISLYLRTASRPLYAPPNTQHTIQTQHHIVERHGLKTAEELAEWLQQANETLSQKQDKDWKRTLKGRNPLVVEKAVAKARKGGFYLGLDHTWLSWDT